MTPRLPPRVNQNDWSVLEAPEPGAWTPTKSVSVVIPAYNARETLPYTLAGLAAQTYPADLFEVLVVDDGSDPPLDLPDVRPAETRLIRASRSWGQANAVAEGAERTRGDVLLRLDADMLPHREHVERHMRWHHLVDHAVVLGHKVFTDRDGLPPVAAVTEAVAADELHELFEGRRTEEHDWVEKIWRRTGELTRAGFRAFHVHVGATSSVSRALYDEAGGMDPSLKLSEDIELGYRLAMKGGVFVADRSATSWHLGGSMLMRQQLEVQRHNAPFIAERVPDFRKFRQDRGRMYAVPVIEVVVEVAGHTFEEVRYTVDGVLQAAPGDTRTVLLGPWSDLRDERRSILDDTRLDLRLTREEYAADGRVAFAEEVPRTAFPALFRLHLPTGWRPGETTMDDLSKDMQSRSLGLRSVVLPDGRIARLERTAAFERAHRVMVDGEDLDDVVDQVSGTWWSEGVEDGFLHAKHSPRPRRTAPGGAGPRKKAVPSPAGEPAAQSAQTRAPAASRVRSAARKVGLGRIRDAVRGG